MAQMGFWEQVRLAWRVLTSGQFAMQVQEAVQQLESTRAQPLPAERVHASGLMLLAAFQREGRLIDFLQQEVAGYTDEDIGAAARVVHAGCRKALRQYFDIAPAMEGTEGAPMSVPAGFDPERIRLTGNVTGQPPFRGTLKHHGWMAAEVRMPPIPDGMDPRVIAPAEVELI
jgi:uncharacterized protein DUF2760